MDDRTIRDRRQREDQDLEEWRSIKREKDLAFQIRVSDWMIVLFLGALVGGILVGIWALIRWVMG